MPVLFLAIEACSSDAAPVAPGNIASPDSGAPAKADGGGGDDDDDDVTNGDAGARPAPVFLAKAEYADLIEIDPKFPWDVTQKHAADGTIVGSRWGRHGGPMASLGNYGDTNEPAVVQWTLPKNPTDPVTAKAIAFEKATGLPDEFFYGADGMHELPFGKLSVLDYSTSASPFAGEALIYDSKYQVVKSRAKANGFYSSAGIATDADNGLLVYSGLSPLADEDSDTADSALYVTGVCNATLLAAAPCPASRKLFGWTGYSGSVVADAHANIFVAAALTGGATSDAVYGLGRKEIVDGKPVTARPIVEVDSTGTASLTALAPDGDADGWVLGLGYADDAPIYAARYSEKSGAIVKGTESIAKAITRGKDLDAISVFTDDEGDLWIAVLKGDEGTFLELRRKP